MVNVFRLQGLIPIMELLFNLPNRLLMNRLHLSHVSLGWLLQLLLSLFLLFHYDLAHVLSQSLLLYLGCSLDNVLHANYTHFFKNFTFLLSFNETIFQSHFFVSLYGQGLDYLFLQNLLLVTFLQVKYSFRLWYRADSIELDGFQGFL